jgi:tetratricopeptide (TPR) repeat protein
VVSAPAATVCFADEPGADVISPIAIVGFSTTKDTDARDTWMATAVEETLCTRMRRVPGLVVMPTVRAYLGRRELEASRAKSADWADVLAHLGVKRRVVGVVSGTAGACRIELTLSAGNVESRKSEFGPGKLFAVLDEATVWLIDQLSDARLDSDLRSSILTPAGETASVLEYYAKAVLSARNDDAREASYYLDRALQYKTAPLGAHLMMAEIELRLSPEARVTASARLRHVQELARARKDSLSEIEVELVQSTILMATGSYDSALTRLERALNLSNELGDVYGRIGVLNAMCDVYLRREARPDADVARDKVEAFRAEQLHKAAAVLETVLSLLDGLGDQIAASPTCNRLALIYERVDETDKSLAMHLRTLAIARELGAPQMQATALMFLGQWYKRQQRFDDARGALQECVSLASPHTRPKVRIALADVLAEQGDTSGAAREYEAAYEVLFEGEDLPNQLLCLERLATLRELAGDREGARKALLDAIDIAEVLELPREKELRDRLVQLRNVP